VSLLHRWAGEAATRPLENPPPLDQTRIEAARARMRQIGKSDAQIARVEAGSEVQARVTLTAPIAGVLSEVAVREGMTVAAGTMLFRING